MLEWRMASSKTRRWTSQSQSLDAWIQWTANINAKLQFPEVDENNRKLGAQCEYYHKRLATIPVRWRETMGRMNIGVLDDFADCVVRLVEMVDPKSPSWHKLVSDVEVVEFLSEYYTWRHLHLDGQPFLNHRLVNATISGHFSHRELCELCAKEFKSNTRFSDRVNRPDAGLALFDADFVEPSGQQSREERLSIDDPHANLTLVATENTWFERGL